MLTIFLTYMLMGILAGILAGLLGIGGGLVIVPILYFCFTAQGIPHEVMMHLALGTSLASIIFTSISSCLAHNKRGAVRWDIFRKIFLGILTGTFLGSCIASALPTNFLKGFFGVFLYFVAYQMITGKKPKPNRTVPGPLPMFGVGNGIGVFSALVGIGGGTLSVPFMAWCNIPIHTAIGTAAAIGLPIALSGTAGFITTGWSAANLPDWSLGYVYLPALLGIVSMSMLTAPLGVRLAHSLPVHRLKRIFAILLLIVGSKMLWSLF
ncbi:sulfite exporter TauE/SafE family protein [Salidesulfovibrio onnuriiensis]|uniref:sulfite exporter TauE/SafE family protein n=1 Tax=Salidesulfovibrio onnuriiensis TaxID=2583823 RepID=UPI0011CAA283|nr:sulfite exporter TauE/SafE family protein [Salidesulfovibrio onnuriiensis]